MKHKVSELSGALLDAAVAKAEGTSLPHGNPRAYRPSMNWRQGGPIIERERMFVAPEFVGGTYYGNWRAIVYGFEDQGERAEETGPGPLIAAMRAYVASKFGEEIEL